MFKIIQLIGLSILAAVVLVACTTNELDKYEIIDKEVIYNGNIQTLEYYDELDGVSVVYENNAHIEVGVYEVKAIFSFENSEKESIATFTILPYTLQLTDLNVLNVALYDGLPKSIELDELDDIDYSFVNKNEYISVGVYYNTLIITSNNKNYNSLEIEIKFEIIQNYELILNNTISNNYEVEFNYDYHSILLDNHDELINYGFEIQYYYDQVEHFPIEAGVYDVYITIQKDNLFKELYGELIINKRVIEINVLGDILIETDNEYSFAIEVDSNYIDISYEYYDIEGNVISKPNEVGHYFIVPVLNPLHNNYEIIPTFKHFEIVLSKKDKDLLYSSTIDDYTVTYDGNYHSILLDNQNELITNGFHIKYSYNMFKEVGVYEVNATINKFGYKKELSASLTINHLVLSPYFNDLDITEGVYYNFIVNGNNNIDVSYKYYNELFEEVGKPSIFGTYYIKALFNNDNENIIINDVAHRFNINLSLYDQMLIDNAYLEDKEVEYNGSYQYMSISNSYELRMSRYSIVYTYNNELTPPINEGTYAVVAMISKNNTVVKVLNATLIIK